MSIHNSDKNSQLFSEGDTVYAKASPSQKLVVRRYVDRIYYCRIPGDQTQEEQVYFERELIAPPD